MDVDDAEPDARIPVLTEEPQRVHVAGAVVVARSQLARVAVGELELELEAVLEVEHRRPQRRVVREADVHRLLLDGGPVEGGVEAGDDEGDLVRLGRGGRLVDLDPGGPGGGESLHVRPDDSFGHVRDEASARVVAPCRGAAERPFSRVVLVVGPILDRVRAGQRNLDLAVGVVLDEAELLHVLGAGDRGLLHHGGLRVVLVVEGANRAAGLEAGGEGGDVVVHLRAPLLSVVDDVEACLLQEADRIPRSPVVYLGEIELLAAQLLDELLLAGDLEKPAPALGFADVLLLERPAGEGLHPPRRLAEAPDLPRHETNWGHAETSSVSAARARPSRTSFSRAMGAGTNWRSPLTVSETPAGFCSRSRWAKLDTSVESSRAELRASMTPAAISFGYASGTDSSGVA
jgi:hypothetical protein